MKVNTIKVLLVDPPQTFFPGSDAPAEVKEIAVMAMKRYRRISLINYIKNPQKTIRTD